MVEIRGGLRLKVIWAFAGLAGLVSQQIKPSSAVVIRGDLGATSMGSSRLYLHSLKSCNGSRLSLNCRMHFTALQKCLSFMMCGAFFIFFFFF